MQIHVPGKWLMALLVILSPVQPLRPELGRAQAGPAVAAATPACVADWYVSYGGTSSYLLVHTDPDNLPLSDLYFSRSYNDPTDLSHGYLDFNRDGRSDVFSAVPIGGGNYRWRDAAPSVINTTWSDWTDLAFDSTPPDQLRFGDFNGDGFTDVFSVTPTGPNDYQWRYSSGGNASYQNLAHDSATIDELRFGDFNCDGRTDVFVLKPLSDPLLAWDISLSGTENYVMTNTASTPLSELQFGDIDGDGHTDVFTTLPDNGNFDWFYSSAAHGSYQTIATGRPQSVHEMLLAGQFDPDNGLGFFHGSDFFYTQPRFDGTNQWWYAHYKTTPSVGDIPLAYDSTPPDQLRFGDFNGDGVTDVFKLQQRCTADLPFLAR